MEDKGKYIQDSSDNVYKVLPTHLLKLSPWEDGEDRRVLEKDINGYKYITYKNACMIINNQFNNTTEQWEHKGKEYLASAISADKDVNEHAYLLSTLPNHKAVIKQSTDLIKNLSDNDSLTISSNNNEVEFKLIKHKGKIYYILILEKYFPRVQAFNIFGEFCCWCGITDCKPVFCKTDKTYI